MGEIEMTRKQSIQGWVDQVRTKFVPSLDKIAAAGLLDYIKLVEKHGATLILRSEKDLDACVTYRDDKFEVTPG